MKMKKCKHCGAEIIAIARICRFCRRHLHLSPVPWFVHFSLLALTVILVVAAKYYWEHPM